jgi:ATP-dependent RNA helicase DDX10/DBP4
VNQDAKFTTPSRLQQNYMPVEYVDKLNVLWSFIKTHLHCKSIIFLSSCKQVHFVHEIFCR